MYIRPRIMVDIRVYELDAFRGQLSKCAHTTWHAIVQCYYEYGSHSFAQCDLDMSKRAGCSRATINLGKIELSKAGIINYKVASADKFARTNYEICLDFLKDHGVIFESQHSVKFVDTLNQFVKFTDSRYFF